MNRVWKILTGNRRQRGWRKMEVTCCNLQVYHIFSLSLPVAKVTSLSLAVLYPLSVASFYLSLPPVTCAFSSPLHQPYLFTFSVSVPTSKPLALIQCSSLPSFSPLYLPLSSLSQASLCTTIVRLWNHPQLLQLIFYAFRSHAEWLTNPRLCNFVYSILYVLFPPNIFISFHTHNVPCFIGSFASFLSFGESFSLGEGRQRKDEWWMLGLPPSSHFQ